MSGNPIEQNPVFADQKKKARKALCAAFAAAACSAGIVGFLGKDNPEKQKIAAAAMILAAVSSSPLGRRIALWQGMAPIRAMSKPFGAGHPYQAEADRLTKAMNIRGVTVYHSTHPTIAAMSMVTDRKDIYIGTDFDAAIAHEGQMKAMIAHEIGHLKEDIKEISASDTFRKVSALNMWMGAGFAAIAPVAPPLAFAAAAGCAGLYIGSKYLYSSHSRSQEHLADLYSLSYGRGKDDLKGALMAMVPGAGKAYNSFVLRQNIINKRDGKPLLQILPEIDPNYKSTWRTHPNTAERIQVVDKAAEYKPL